MPVGSKTSNAETLTVHTRRYDTKQRFRDM